ncbi:hypothetical protein pb186bvf_018897 [Paramecium bursaria]
MLNNHDSGQSTQPMQSQPGQQVFPPMMHMQYPMPQILSQPLNGQQLLNERNISEEIQNIISDAFIDLDILFLKHNVQKKAHIKLFKDKTKESKLEIGDIKVRSKWEFAKSIINIRYNKETKDNLENLRNSHYDKVLYEQLFGPCTENEKRIFDELKEKLDQIRYAIR